MEQVQSSEQELHKKRPSLRMRLSHWLQYRTLLWEFLKRDLQARYVGSTMGLFWSVINPIILLGLYTFVFGFVVKPDFTGRFIPDTSTPLDIALYIFCGLLPWYSFQEAIIRCTTCIVDNAHLIRQIRFPAKILPAYLVLSSVVNQIIGTVVLVIGIWLIRGTLSVTMLAFPIVLLFQSILAFGLGLFLATLHVYLRDTAPLVSIAVMIVMWTTPMFYVREILPPRIDTLVLCNPFSHLILLYHNIFLLKTWPLWTDWLWIVNWAVVISMSFLAFFIGYRIFTRSHREFIDVI